MSDRVHPFKEPESGIQIAKLNPDTDGDGKIDKWEKEVYGRIEAADTDKSGCISPKELFAVFRAAAQADKLKKLYRHGLLVSITLLVVFLFANFGLTTSGAHEPRVHCGLSEQSLTHAGAASLFLSSRSGLPVQGHARAIALDHPRIGPLAPTTRS